MEGNYVYVESHVMVTVNDCSSKIEQQKLVLQQQHLVISGSLEKEKSRVFFSVVLSVPGKLLRTKNQGTDHVLVYSVVTKTIMVQ
jgi:hypothetical protein